MSKTPLTQLTAACLLLLAPASAAVGPQAPEEILWLDAEHSRPYVIPESAFAGTDWSDPSKASLASLPLTDEQRQYLRSRVAGKLESGGAGTCTALATGIGESFGLVDPPQGSQTLADLAQAVDLAVAGRVSRLVAVWDPVVKRPWTRVFLEVEEVLRDPRGRAEAGGELSYLLPFGEISIGPLRECMEAPAGAYVPALGDRLLLLGWPDPVNRSNVFGRSYFEIREGNVLPRGHLLLRDRSPHSLAALERELASASREER